MKTELSLRFFLGIFCGGAISAGVNSIITLINLFLGG